MWNMLLIQWVMGRYPSLDTHLDTQIARFVDIRDWVYDLGMLPYKKPTYSWRESLLILVVAGILISIGWYFFMEKSLGFAAGLAIGLGVWQLNYRNYYGHWFNYPTEEDREPQGLPESRRHPTSRP